VGNVEPSHLVELALGHASGDADAGALRHVASCPRCREELAQMTRVVTAARGAEVSDLTAAPPERVWQRIAHEVLHEAGRLPRPREHPARRSAAETATGVRLRRTARTGTSAGLLVLAGVTGALLVRWLWVMAGRGPDQRPARRLRSPWWHRAC
jgi:hypothetical protein